MPGGSSGGSAAALAAGLVALAPGTDTGGSIRVPASCCGVVGLKPTFGRVSLAGIRPLCPTFDHCGPLARSVYDCALALEVLAGPSPRDPRTPPVPSARYTTAVGRGVRGLTVAVAERFFFEHATDDVAQAARAGIESLREAGARIVEIDLDWPFPGYSEAMYLAEEAAVMRDFWPGRRADLGTDVVRSLEAAERLTALEVSSASALRLDYQTRTLQAVAEAGIALIVTPTLAFAPPLLGTLELPFAGRAQVEVTDAMCGLTEIYNVLGWPALSVPCGTDALGLPVGLQLAALPWREVDCLAAAAVVERQSQGGEL